jgi:hypothetical protein
MRARRRYEKILRPPQGELAEKLDFAPTAPAICQRLRVVMKPVESAIAASFLFRATGSRGHSCLFPGFTDVAQCPSQALSSQHRRDLLAGSWLRTLRFHGYRAAQPTIGASALSYVQSEENGKVFTAEDLSGSRRLLGVWKSRSSPRDELVFVKVV